MQRFDVDQLTDLMMLTPGEEILGRMHVGRPGVFVPDGRAEEFQVAAGCARAGGRDHRRDEDAFQISATMSRAGLVTVSWRPDFGSLFYIGLV